METSKGSGSGFSGEPEREKIKITDRRKVRPEGEATPPENFNDPEPSKDPQRSQPVDELAEARQQAASHLDDLQRLKADFENYRKRIMKEQSETAERAAAGLVSRLLAVLDNFDLAVAAAEETTDFERMRKGVEMVFGEFKEVLSGEGLEPIDAKGQKFDPTVHEAALEIGEGDGDPVVAEVLRPGYYLKGRVLRPAMVKIIRGGSTYQDGDSKD